MLTLKETTWPKPDNREHGEYVLARYETPNGNQFAVLFKGLEPHEIEGLHLTVADLIPNSFPQHVIGVLRADDVTWWRVLYGLHASDGNDG